MGQACISGLRYSCDITQNGKWQRNVFSFPKAIAPNLKWLSPELLKQVNIFFQNYVKNCFLNLCTISQEILNEKLEISFLMVRRNRLNQNTQNSKNGKIKMVKNQTMFVIN